MEEPFGGAMTMDERSDLPQVLGSKGSEPRADPGAGAPIQEGRASRATLQASSPMLTVSGPARAKRPVKEMACDATPS